MSKERPSKTSGIRRLMHICFDSLETTLGKRQKSLTHTGAASMFVLCSLNEKEWKGGRKVERKSNVQTELESALVGINFLAERLQLSRRTIHRILARGELPSIQIGRRRLVRLSELHRWLDGCETQQPPQNIAETL
jgi:excisionase family DNA binding protein